MVTASRHCQHRLLARSGQHEVTVCGCGHVHLTVGPVTVRLETSMLGELTELLTSARASLAESTPTTVRGHARLAH